MQCRLPVLVLLLLAAPAGAQAPPGPIPAALAAAEDRPLMTLSAKGVQVYRCRAGILGEPPEWAFQEPRAELFLAERQVGRHYAGPTWEHEDGSVVTGRATVRVEAPEPHDDVLWLRLEVSTRRNAGAFSDVAAIQRVNTRGGALVGACTEIDRVSEVPYTCDYIMLGRR